jgi:anti-sigma-K factor RskA
MVDRVFTKAEILEIIGNDEIAYLYGSEKQLSLTNDADIFQNHIAIGNNALRATQRQALAKLVEADGTLRATFYQSEIELSPLADDPVLIDDDSEVTP